jgi:hypothetical protein
VNMESAPQEFDDQYLSPATPRNPARTFMRVSVTTSACASILFLAVFFALWGPVYLTGAETNLFLFPVALIAMAPVLILGVTAIATGATALLGRRSGGGFSLPWAVAGMVTGALIVLLAVPVLWFGNAPLSILNH